MPHFGVGGAVLSAGGKQMFQNLSKKLTSVLGRKPTQEELKQLEKEIAELAKPTSSMRGANLERVAKQEPHANMFANTEGRVFPPTAEGKMPTPGQREYQGFDQAFDPRDNFITQMNTGRGNRGTWLHANPDVDMADEASILNRMDTGTDLGGYPGQSTTPANDYIAELADAMQASGVKHDYTGMGTAVMGNKPSFPPGALTGEQKAMRAQFEQQADDAGIAESAIRMSPSDLAKKFKRLEEERRMGPAGPEASMGGYAAGGLAKNIGSQAALELPFSLPQINQIKNFANQGKFGEAGVNAAGIAYSALTPLNAATAGAGLMAYSPEVGDATLSGYKRQEEERARKEAEEMYWAKRKAEMRAARPQRRPLIEFNTNRFNK